jgi:hypothetical protein
MDLVEYLRHYTQQGECKCDECTGGDSPNPNHTADMVFFLMSAKNDPDPAEFIRLTKEHVPTLAKVDPFDGEIHSYIELGGWFPDQGIALVYMGLGTLLGLFELQTPRIILPQLSDAQHHQMAKGGMITIIDKHSASS